jgi:hypothetical protein
LATHAFVAVDALLVGYVSVNVFLPICAFSLLHAAFARSTGEGPSSTASAAGATARASSAARISVRIVLPSNQVYG